MKIINWCKITESAYSLNGEQGRLSENEGQTAFLTGLYKELGCDYPKFHKMDQLSKTAFLGVELLVKECPHVLNYEDDAVALLFANSESSEYSDLKFETSYKIESNPGPSYFVYTLPNIMLGELAIRNKWLGESLYIFQPVPDWVSILQHLRIQFTNGAKACIFGWVNVTGEQPVAFFCIIEKDADQGMELTTDKLESFYIHNNDKH